MGGCTQSKPVDVEAKKRNDEITKALKEEKEKQQNEVKLLLLGAGESGKSTIAKQMRLIYLNGFSEEDRSGYKSIIHNNIISSIKALVEAAKAMKFEFKSENQELAQSIMDMGENSSSGFSLTKEMGETVKRLWADPAVKSAYERQSEFQLNDSAAYYFTEIDRILGADYVPTLLDVLRSRAKTTGIIETDFVIEGTKFRMVDVGGQRSERKKWMNCFSDVTAVIFCVAMSEYDLKLHEDNETNRMQESLKLFKEICNSKWFHETAMILFLNKKDLFAQKIKEKDLTVCEEFKDYKGGKDYVKAVQFITDKFLQQNENPKKHIYVHETCATDTKQITVVFNIVKDVILHQILNQSGIAF